ncbi:MAG: hypothetical protein VKL59_05725 [Nostocaceae cyanobacterium]|nr:hypothetical protein [Nostocaceae cyanobacterium]
MQLIARLLWVLIEKGASNQIKCTYSKSKSNDLQILPIKLNHIYQIVALPNHHRDRWR